MKPQLRSQPKNDESQKREIAESSEPKHMQEDDVAGLVVLDPRPTSSPVQSAGEGEDAGIAVYLGSERSSDNLDDQESEGEAPGL
jgi:hypothetical protein